MRKEHQQQLDALIDIYGAWSIANAVITRIRTDEAYSDYECTHIIQDAWMGLAEGPAGGDLFDLIHSRPCSLCGEPSGQGTGDMHLANWYLCPGCEGSPEAEARGYTHTTKGA